MVKLPYSWMWYDPRQEPQMPGFQQSVDQYSSNIIGRNRSPLKFFLLVFALSIPAGPFLLFTSYDAQRFIGLITAFTAAIVTVVWGP
jgi:tetrahydromethanopterin S-methyltransferase subunit F